MKAIVHSTKWFLDKGFSCLEGATARKVLLTGDGYFYEWAGNVAKTTANDPFFHIKHAEDLQFVEDNYNLEF